MQEMQRLIDTVITKDALAHKIKYAQKHKLKEETFFYKDLAKHLERLAQQMRSDEFLDPSISIIKNRFEVVKEFTAELINSHGQLEYDDDFKKITISKIPFLMDIINTFDGWTLKYNSGRVNYWCREKFKCVFHNTTIYQLQNNSDGTLFEFELPEEKSMHFYMFWVPPEKQNQGIGKRNFKTICEKFFAIGIGCLFSPCLGGDMPSRPHNNSPEWRLEYDHHTPEGIRVNKLGAWWQKVGGIFLRYDNMNENNLYFFSEKEIYSMVEKEKDSWDFNPWENVTCGGIYSDEFVKFLKYI
jgi:hypothetical protein